LRPRGVVADGRRLGLGGDSGGGGGGGGNGGILALGLGGRITGLKFVGHRT